MILIWAKSPSDINYLSVWLSLFSAIPMESHYAMAQCNKDRWSTVYFALKSSLRMTLGRWRGMGSGMRHSFAVGTDPWGRQLGTRSSKDESHGSEEGMGWTRSRQGCRQGSRGTLLWELVETWESV